MFPVQTTRGGSMFPVQTTRGGSMFPVQTSRGGSMFPVQTTRGGSMFRVQNLPPCGAQDEDRSARTGGAGRENAVPNATAVAAVDKGTRWLMMEGKRRLACAARWEKLCGAFVPSRTPRVNLQSPGCFPAWGSETPVYIRCLHYVCGLVLAEPRLGFQSGEWNETEPDTERWMPPARQKLVGKHKTLWAPVKLGDEVVTLNSLSGSCAPRGYG
ncbi:unnamed protein product [Arctogadus glacialis]